MVVRVVRQVLKALPRAVVATDDDRIARVVRDHGYEAVMTSPNHPSGTDRCLEAFKATGSDAEGIINVQGDEPFIHPEQILAVAECLRRPGVDIATLIRPFPADAPYSQLENPNTPKVVVDSEGNALYFSRSVIPYLRGEEPARWPSAHQYFTHVGMYGYRSEALAKVVEMPRSPLEIAESLEQLRWLQGGMRIATAPTTLPTIGIDTPADLEAARQFIQDNYPRK